MPTFATWGLVLATFLLVVAAIFQYFDGKSRSSEERDRWERAERKRGERDRQELLDRFVDRFNSPPMLIARAELARQMLGSPQSSWHGVERTPDAPTFRFPCEVPLQTWTLVDFFERLARHWKQGSLDIGPLDDAFSDYILVLTHEFKAQISREDISAKYDALNGLASVLLERHEHTSTTPGVDPIYAGWSETRRDYWFSEFKLFRLFPGILPELADHQTSSVDKSKLPTLDRG